jgi:hypothetical protein
MQVQHHVNSQNRWFPCKVAEVKGDRLECVIDLKRPYDLMEVYTKAPHERFLNLSTNAELSRFVEIYGPLVMVNNDESRPLVPSKTPHLPLTSVSSYWAYQRWLKSLLHLIKGVGNANELRDRLEIFMNVDVRVENQRVRRGAPPTMQIARAKSISAPNDPRNLGEWIRTAPIASVRQATTWTIQASISVNARLLVVPGGGHGGQVIAGTSIPDLRSALEWMVWQDEYRKRPLIFCAECGKARGATSAHKVKYCGEACAHRVAARNHARKRRSKLKKKLRANRSPKKEGKS